MNKDSINSNKMYQDTLSFFIQTLTAYQNNSAAMRSLNTKNAATRAYLYLEQDQLVFSIEGLYQQIKHPNCLSYNHYRRMLYASTLNYDLAKQQLKIVNYNDDLAITANLYRVLLPKGLATVQSSR